MHASSRTDDIDSSPSNQTRLASWTAVIVIAVTQIMMIFDISTLQVTMDAIAGSLGTATA